MTDKTQPEALIHAAWLEKSLTIGAKEAAAELRRQHARIAELEAQLEAIGAGGVQALSAAPSDIAKLRHLYANLKNGGVRDTAQAKRIADGLLAPIIERLEQAATKAAPAGFVPVSAFDRLHAHAESLAARLLAAEQAAPKAAPGEPVAWRISDPNEPDLGFWLAEEDGGEGFLSEPLYTRTAPQAAGQDARPCHVFTVRKAGGLTEWEPTTMALALPDGAHALYTLPQPSPHAQADSVTAPAVASEPIAYLYDDGSWTPAKTEEGHKLNNWMISAGSPKIGVHLASAAPLTTLAQATQVGNQQEAQELNRLRAMEHAFHKLMEKHELHPGRTDDDLLQILDAHLQARGEKAIGEVVIGEGPTGGAWNVIKWREDAPQITPGMKLYTAPQPAPAAQGDALDAARYRWLRDTSNADDPSHMIALHIRDEQNDASLSGIDAAIDAARKESDKP